MHTLFFIVDKQKRELIYSSGANMGSQGGSIIGFCWSIARISAGTYFFSTTTLNM